MQVFTNKIPGNQDGSARGCPTTRRTSIVDVRRLALQRSALRFPGDSPSSDQPSSFSHIVLLSKLFLESNRTEVPDKEEGEAKTPERVRVALTKGMFQLILQVTLAMNYASALVAGLTWCAWRTVTRSPCSVSEVLETFCSARKDMARAATS